MTLECALRLDRGRFHLDVELRFDGSALGLYGPSGAGKTTLFRLLAGLLHPDRGRIALGGRTLLDTERRIALPPEARRMGVVFQEPRLFPHLSVRRNLLFGRRAGGRAERAAGSDGAHGLDAVVDLFELGSLLEARPAELSGGEAQRVALGRALLREPDLLLLDEPLSALDPRLKRQILPFLRRVRDRAGVPLISISHDLDELLELTDDLALLRDGRLVARGRVGALLGEAEALAELLAAGLSNVVPGRLTASDEDAGVALVEIAPGVHLRAFPVDLPIGSDVVAVVPAGDVAIATGDLSGAELSIVNRLPGRVTGLGERGGVVVAEVDVGVPLRAELSADSTRRLALAPGREVCCLFKAGAVQVHRR